jgi:5'(3')-deoxyribonucleotidase
MKVYFDMDGLLADFDGHVEAHYPELKGVNTWNIPDDEFWPKIKSIPNFWRGLPVNEGAIELWDLCHAHFEVAILSAHSTHDERSISGKKVWLDKHLPTHKYNYNRHFTKTKEDHADEYSILIDDLVNNCDKFDKAGGASIHHTDIKHTTNIIKELVNNLNHH